MADRQQEQQRRMNVEQGLQRVGSLALYQIRSFIFLFIPGLFHIARMTSVAFAVEYRSPYRCAIPGWTNDTYASGSYYHEVTVNETIPPDNHCKVYNISRTYDYDQYHRPMIDANATGDFQSCPNGWVYDDSVIKNTVRMQFDLVCDKHNFPSYVDTCLMGGSLVGAVVFGAISDRYGRLIGLLCSVPVCVGAGLGITWAPNYIVLTVLFALAGAGCTGMFTCAFVLALESVLPAHRNVPGLWMQIFLPLGEILMAGVGYGFRDWGWMNITISAPAILFLFYYWLLSESPLWLNAHNKMERLMILFTKIARTNNSLDMFGDDELREELEGFIQDEDNDAHEVRDSIVAMFTSSCVLLTRSLATLLNWFAVNYVYYGLILFTANLSDDLYLNFFLGAVVEIPAHLISLLLVNRLGRKPVHCGYFFLVIVSTGAATAMKAAAVGHHSVVEALTMIGKFGAAGLMGTSFLWMVELYPVSVRSTGAGIMAIAAKLGAIVVPFVNEKGHNMRTDIGQAVPYIGFCSFSVVACLVVFIFLPETANRVLPTTVAEARYFGRPRPLLNVIADEDNHHYGAIPHEKE